MIRAKTRIVLNEFLTQGAHKHLLLQQAFVLNRSFRNKRFEKR